MRSCWWSWVSSSFSRIGAHLLFRSRRACLASGDLVLFPLSASRSITRSDVRAGARNKRLVGGRTHRRCGRGATPHRGGRPERRGSQRYGTNSSWPVVGIAWFFPPFVCDRQLSSASREGAHQQLALTIAIRILSAFNALTLSPALSGSSCGESRRSTDCTTSLWLGKSKESNAPLGYFSRVGRC